MLGRTNVARLACARNNQPYVVPIHVDLDREFLYSFATEGLKIDWMRQNPLVCVEIDEISPQADWASVVVFGRYEEIPLLPEYGDLRRVAERLFQRHPMWWQPASVPLPGHEQRTSIVFRIRIDRVTGRRGSYEAGKAPVQENPSDARRPSWLARVLRHGNPADLDEKPASRTKPHHTHDENPQGSCGIDAIAWRTCLRNLVHRLHRHVSALGSCDTDRDERFRERNHLDELVD